MNGIKGIKEVYFLKRIFKDIEILDYPPEFDTGTPKLEVEQFS